MLLTPIPSALPALASEAEAGIGGIPAVRSPGLHLSDIYRDIERTIKPRDEWATQEELEAFGEVGFLWERVFSMAYRDAIQAGDPQTYIRPGEFVKDGIACSPDLIRIRDWALIETKASWKSAKKFDDLNRWFYFWVIQVCAYCHVIGTDTAEIHALFINGDYKPPIPQKRATRIVFTEKEMRDNWAMLCAHARRRGWLPK